MNNINLAQPTRQSLKGLVFIFIQGLRQLIRMFWAIILVVFLQNKWLDDKRIIAYIGVAVLFLLVIHSILYYLNFYFYVTDTEFILKKGYLRKKTLTIPLDRIQSVNTKQNLIQQILNVVTLEIDTAGAAAKELKIHALEKLFATELNNLIKSGKEDINTVDADIQAEEEKETEKLVLKLSPADLLKIGLSQNHLKAGLIIVAFGFQIFQQVEDLFKEKAEEYSGEFVQFMSNSSLALIVFLLVFFLIVSVLFSLVRTVFKYYDFTLVKKSNKFRIESGLLNKRNVLIPYNKVQELNWETGPLKQLFGIYNLVFKQAVSGQNRKVQVVDAPGCLAVHLEALKTDLFGEDSLTEVPRIFTDSFYFRRLWLLMGWLPVLLPAGFLFNEWLFWIGVVLWLLGTAGYSYLMLKKRYFRINNYQIRISKGAISQKWEQMELFKIQSVEFRQTIFQKRRKLASLRLTNASGSLTIPYINQIMARQMYDYLLFHTETSEKRWM